jgi:hypothetical protein
LCTLSIKPAGCTDARQLLRQARRYDSYQSISI